MQQATFNNKSFTLIELVIVVGILAVIAAVVVIVINPAEYMKSSRDASRIADFATLKKSIGLYLADGKSGIGSTNIVYVSIPDSSATCANLGLPSLPDGWSYQCSTSANYRKTDGNGWLPIDFTQVSFGDVVQTLPVDPVNTTSTGNYYTYVTGGSWQLSTIFESTKYNQNLTSQYYTTGTNSNLLPASFNFAQLASYADAVMKLSTINGYAFITSSSINLAPYVGKYVTISYGANSIAGFIKAQGTGETYGSELIVNGNMEAGGPPPSAPTSWVPSTGSGVSEQYAEQRTGGTGSYSLRVHGAITDNHSVRETLVSNIQAGTLSKTTFWVKSFGSTIVNFYINSGGAWSFGIDGNWAQKMRYSTNVSLYGWVYLYNNNNKTLGSLWDDFSIKQILTPDTSGVTITNTRGGNIYNWLSNTGINPNAASFTVTISP